MRIKHCLPTILLYVLTLPVLQGGIVRLQSLKVQPAATDWITQRYFDHPIISVLHILPGLIFLLLAPLQFTPLLRQNFPRLHRNIGKVFIVTGILSGLSVIWMVFVLPAVGGLLTQVSTTALNLLMIALLIHAWRSAKARRFAQHRASMIRAYAIGLSVSTARIFISLAESYLGLPFQSSFTGASIIGIALNIAVAEWIIRRPIFP